MGHQPGNQKDNRLLRMDQNLEHAALANLDQGLPPMHIRNNLDMRMNEMLGKIPAQQLRAMARYNLSFDRLRTLSIKLLRQNRLDGSDIVSVMKLQAMYPECIQYYQPQKKDEACDIEQHFVSSIADPWQLQMLGCFGHRPVCLDATGKTSSLSPMSMPLALSLSILSPSLSLFLSLALVPY